jgi:hypothetical protein
MEQTIERIGVNGMGREVVKSRVGSCVKALTLDFSTFTIFYLDSCTLQLISIRMDGVRTSSTISIALSSLTSSGLSVYQDFIYWTDSTTRTLRRANRTTEGATVEEIVRTEPTLFGGVEVVHPDKQPFGKS